MAGPREVLSRFRPAGTPGASAGGAVPADREAEWTTELAPVFESLDGAEAEAREIRARAAAEATAIREEASRQAEALVRDARERAPLEAEQAARLARLETEEYCAAILARSRAAAESVRLRAQPRLDAYVEQVVADVAARLNTPRPRYGPTGPGPDR